MLLYLTGQDEKKESGMLHRKHPLCGHLPLGGRQTEGLQNQGHPLPHLAETPESHPGLALDPLESKTPKSPSRSVHPNSGRGIVGESNAHC